MQSKIFFRVGTTTYWDQRQYDSRGRMAGVTELCLTGNAVCGITPYEPSGRGIANRVISRRGRYGGPTERGIREFYKYPFPITGPNEALLMARAPHTLSTGEPTGSRRRPITGFLSATEMKNGDAIPSLVGWEFHGDPADIPGLEVVADGTALSGGARPVHWTATIYLGPRKNFVFNASTIWWAQGLASPPAHMLPWAHWIRPHGPERPVAAHHAESARASARKEDRLMPVPQTTKAKFRLRPQPIAAVLLSLLVAALIATGGAPATTGEDKSPTGLAAIHVPAGFKVEKVAGAKLVNYPMMGTIDDRGRLFLCESSGNTLTTDQMAAKPDYVIRMLEDTDGDGVYDRSTVFADKLTLPAGAVWYRGSLYVALAARSDPAGGYRWRRRGRQARSDRHRLDISRPTPPACTDLSSARTAGSISPTAATVSTSRPRMAAQFKGVASRIWRVRPDGTGLEWVCGRRLR